MALGKNNKRIRGAFGDNGHFKFGDPLAWEQYGKSNRWSLTYEIGLAKSTMADKSQVKTRDIRDVMLEIDLAQSHVDEIQLIDLLMNSESISFWGSLGKIGSEDMELYIPELIVGGSIKIETPASDNIKIPLQLGVQPQGDVFAFQDTDLPTASKHGGTIITSDNEFFASFVAVPD